jgi:acetolactate synthase-1/2/3 large subunit
MAGGNRLNARQVMSALAECQPEGAVIIDEGVSSAGLYLSVAHEAPAFTYLSLTGGATGFALPCAVGAAFASADRKIVTLVGDGSAMYTVQALWTQAREKLNVLNVILVNDSYRILQLELARASQAGGVDLTEIRDPQINWVSLAQGLGVDAVQVADAESLKTQLRRMAGEKGPHLLAVKLS